MGKIVVVMIAIVGIALLWFFLKSDSPKELPNAVSTLSTQIAPSSDATPAASTSDDETVEPADAETCLTPSQLETSNLFKAEQEIMEALSGAGSQQVNAYRGNTRDQVLPFAEQNDSAAMVVLGAMAMVRGRGEDESRAFEFLNPKEGAGLDLIGPQIGVELTDAAAADYQEAYDWFYKAALYGRLLALANAGEARYAMEPSPIKQGWISREDYDSLPRREKGNLQILSLYNTAMSQIAGNPSDGMLGIILSIQPRTQIVDDLALTISEQFEIDRKAAGLPAIHIPKSTLPSPEEIVSMVCKEYWPKEALKNTAN